MSRPELGDVIAERELEVDGAGHAVVRIGRPTPDPRAGGDWRCPFQIIGLGDEGVYEAFGVDAVQALQLCLQLIDIHLGEQRRAREVTWLGSADLGFFPVVNFAGPLGDEGDSE